MRRHVIAAAIALVLTGCYNIVVINVGVANKSAAALAAPFDLEAFCAALANHSVQIEFGSTKAQQEYERLCENAEKKKGTK